MPSRVGEPAEAAEALTVDIRRIKAADITDFVEAWGELAAKHAAMDRSFAPSRDWVEEYEDYLHLLLRRTDTLPLVAVEDGVVAGIATGRLVTLPGFFEISRRGHIQDVYVRPAFRRRGIGRKMVEEILTWMRRNRVNLIELTVATDNPEAIRFWEALGFSTYMVHMRKGGE